MAQGDEVIRNPIEWTQDQLSGAARYARLAGRAVKGEPLAAPVVRRISMDDLALALRRGLEDLGPARSDVIFLCLVYPLAGVVLAAAAFRYELLPLLFPLASGFALLGPVFAVGLYEMSRRREQGQVPGWADAFRTVRSPSFGAIFLLGLILLVIFLIWIACAQGIYSLTLGPAPPESLESFARDVLTTSAGRWMILIGCAVGFLFALLVLAIAVVSFPLLLDRDVGLATAVATSVRATLANPVPVAAWGLIVAVALVLGMLPLFLGLAFVLPLLGHATWHLYRRLVEPPPSSAGTLPERASRAAPGAGRSAA
jgi:uncharacterized membrane protein